MNDRPNTTVDQLMLFDTQEIPKAPIPVSDASPEWRDALTLKIAESVRFDPERLAAYEASVKLTAPGSNPRRFLDLLIEQMGGRSQ